MEGYRTATQIDYVYILNLLIGGDKDKVLVRPVNSIDELYPLTDVSKGDYSLTEEGIAGFSLNGEECVIRITDTPLHYIELKRGSCDWIAPETLSVILLVPE